MGEILVTAITLVFGILRWAIIIKILVSWLPMANIHINDPYKYPYLQPVLRALSMITDPILDPLRKYTTVGMIDLSPIVAIFGLLFIERILLQLLGASTSGGLF